MEQKILAKGFTLIELLIVVAIIAILAAIAVPNFLEAQTRSKVSRIKSDMRSMATALESYCVDANQYLPDGMGGLHPGFYTNLSATEVEGCLQMFSRLTTPVAYLSSVPPDPCWSAREAKDYAGAGAGTRDETVRVFRYYESTGWGYNVMAAVPGLKLRGKWIMLSPGPDRVHGYSEWVLVDDPNVVNRVYDPTNGTVSQGDIVRWGP